jgi:hypothetical protein
MDPTAAWYADNAVFDVCPSCNRIRDTFGFSPQTTAGGGASKSDFAIDD